tara:strand:- start:7 stop:210 length:204 start_codon:yes stop_codon:yes gene_type:complete
LRGLPEKKFIKDALSNVGAMLKKPVYNFIKLVCYLQADWEKYSLFFSYSELCKAHTISDSSFSFHNQ